MVGGDADAFARLEPFFKALRPRRAGTRTSARPAPATS